MSSGIGVFYDDLTQ